MIVGIDLGTTNSLVAVWQDGAPRLIPNALGETLTPSCVSIDSDGSVLVGRVARERLQTHPDRTVATFKRYMGSDRTFTLHKRAFRAEELSSLVLRSLKADAEALLGESVDEAIITVPAYFSDAQRKATRVAGQLAGLQVDRLVNEPTAAALAYGIHQRDSASRFLVFDLGGGTFDVSVLELFEGVMEVRASAGDNFLGGEDFVTALMELFFERNKLPAKLRGSGEFMQQLAARTEVAKRALSAEKQTTIRVRNAKNEYALDIDEALLESTCAHLLRRLRDPVERALRDANLRGSELDQIVLAGGATRMPLVRRLVTQMFGRFPATDINPDEVVALGAAVQAGLKMRDVALKEVVMTDVSPYSLGVEVSVTGNDQMTVSGYFDPVIERNSPIPISRVKRYFPVMDRQSHIELQIYQGEARMVMDNIHLGSLRVPVPIAPRQDCGVDVRFTYDVNGILQVEATVLKTSQTFSVIIQGNPGMLTDAEIAQRLKALSELKIHPRDRMEHRTLLARAERIYQLMRGESREWFGRQVLEYEKLLDKQDMRAIEPARQKFEHVVNEIERDSYVGALDRDPMF